MPLIESPSHETVGENIAELESTGKYPHEQAVAIALSIQRRARGEAEPVAKGAPEYRMDAREAMEEHLRLLQVLASPDHHDDLEELARQARELPRIAETVGKGGEEPSAAQKAAGNYQKDHMRLFGLPISIENRVGTTRSGEGPEGPWSVTMPYDYGYIKGTEGADGDQIDVCIGPLGELSDDAHIINQKNPVTGEFDEHKIMLGWGSREEAVQAYRNGRDDEGKQTLGSVITVPVAMLKEWVRAGHKTEEAVLKALGEGDDLEEICKSEQTRVTHYTRVVDGRVQFVPDHDRAVNHRQAHLHERTIADRDRSGQHRILAMDAEDQREIMEAARRVGIAPHTVRRTGATLHGRTSSYPGLFFHSASDTERVMEELRRTHEANAPVQPQEGQQSDHATQVRILSDGLRRQYAENDRIIPNGTPRQLEEAADTMQRLADEMDRIANDSTAPGTDRLAAQTAARSAQVSALTLRTVARQREHAEAQPNVPVPQAQGPGETVAQHANDPAGELVHRSWMENTAEGHNKFYAIDIRKVATDQYVVNIAYGSRASRSPTVRTLTPVPVRGNVAHQLLAERLGEKVGRGYRVMEQAVAQNDRIQHQSTHLDNFRPQTATAPAAAAPAPPAAPEPAATPAATTPSPATTRAYETARQRAYDLGNVARNTDSQSTPEAIRNSVAAYKAHMDAIPMAQELGIHTGTDRGVAWHQQRANVWIDKAKTQWGTLLRSVLTRSGEIDNAVRTGNGYASAMERLNGVLSMAQDLPPEIQRGIGPVERDSLNDTKAGLQAGIQIERLRGGQGTSMHQKADKIAEVVEQFNEAHPWVGDYTQDLGGAIRGAGTFLAGAEAAASNHSLTPEQIITAANGAKAAIHTLQQKWQAASRQTIDRGNPHGLEWLQAIKPFIEKMTEATTKAVGEAERRARIPQTADHRYVRIHERVGTEAREAHARATAQGATREHKARAVDAHKKAAVAAYHHALTLQGPEREAAMRKAQEHADHARNFVAELNRR